VEQSPMQPISRPSLDQFSDEELTALALAADTGAPIDPDAVAWDGALLHQSGLLPDWYMPTPVGRRIGRWPRTVVIELTQESCGTRTRAEFCSKFRERSTVDL
jgi:hypothetical protein